MTEEVVFACGYEPYHEHRYPADWEFGGPAGTHPGTDPRYKPTTYCYFSDKIMLLDITQVPLCDDQAIDEFTKVAGYGPGFNPVYLQATRPDGTVEMIPWVYDKAKDEVYPRE